MKNGGIVFAIGGSNMKVVDKSCYCTVLYSSVTVDNWPHVNVGFFLLKMTLNFSSLANLVKNIIEFIKKMDKYTLVL
jgi:hypothetical protein